MGPNLLAGLDEGGRETGGKPARIGLTLGIHQGISAGAGVNQEHLILEPRWRGEHRGGGCRHVRAVDDDAVHHDHDPGQPVPVPGA